MNERTDGSCRQSIFTSGKGSAFYWRCLNVESGAEFPNICQPRSEDENVAGQIQASQNC